MILRADCAQAAWHPQMMRRQPHSFLGGRKFAINPTSHEPVRHVTLPKSGFGLLVLGKVTLHPEPCDVGSTAALLNFLDDSLLRRRDCVRRQWVGTSHAVHVVFNNSRKEIHNG
jgi:hypothetical protein